MCTLVLMSFSEQYVPTFQNFVLLASDSGLTQSHNIPVETF